MKTLKNILIFTLAMTLMLSIPLAALAVDPGTLPQRVRFTISAYSSPTSGGTVSGGGSFYEGDRVILEATPYLGYRFSGWYNQEGYRVSPESVFELYAYENTVLEGRFVRDYTVNPPSPIPTPVPTPPPAPDPIDPGIRPPAGQIAVMIAGRWVSYDVPPQVVNGRTLVPLRATFEALGAYVDWNETTQTVIATRGTTNVMLTLGQNYATVNGERVTLEVPGETLGGRTLVPLRFVSEALGANVDWNPQTLNITITQAAVIH